MWGRKDKNTYITLGLNQPTTGTEQVAPATETFPTLTANIDEPVVAININRQYPRVKNTDDLLQATRSMWRLNRDRANRAHYAFAVYQGEIKEVYQVERWIPATKETRRYWREREKLQGDDFQETHDGRSEFIGKVAPETIRKKYVGKRMPVRHGQNPIRYFNC
ncbi:MAG TPA: hypothetical protein VD835_15720 [Pyrinomonadaceae bacterium]|nr:hypothetical protein [Pyrinomonadaceae bacterium]